MIEKLEEIISSTGWDFQTVTICLAGFLIFAGAYILGIVAGELHERCIIGGRGWLIIFIFVNIINFFLLKNHYLIAFGLGTFLSLSFYNVSANLYDFETTGYFYLHKNNDPRQNVILVISLIMQLIHIVLLIFNIRYFQ